MRREILLGETLFVYEFTRKRVKNLNLRIRADGSAAVSAPLRMPVERVEDFLRSRQDFIRRAMERTEREPTPCGAAEGDKAAYLGGALRLRFEEGKHYGARRTESELCLTLPGAGEEARRRAALERWEKEESRRIMTELAQRIYPAFAPFGVPWPELRFRAMRSRWGSCMPRKGVVTLNTRLLAYPVRLMEYIIVHEFCHFLQADHSPAFYAWMDRFLPDWRERRRELNGRK